MSADERLINAVRDFPILYDKSNEGYKNVDLKNRIWKKISCETQIDVERCKKKWKTLRDQYVRERNLRMAPSSSIALQKKMWKYYTKLSFLDDHINGKKPVPQFECNDGILQAYNDGISQEFVSNSSSAPLVHIKNEKCALNSEDDNSSYMVFKPSYRIGKRNEHNESETLKNLHRELIQAIKNQSNNEIDLYFLNLAKIVANEKLSSVQFLDLQSKLNMFLKEQILQYKK